MRAPSGSSDASDPRNAGEHRQPSQSGRFWRKQALVLELLPHRRRYSELEHSEDDVLRDAGFPDSGQHVGPHRAVVLLVALLDAGHQTRVKPDLHPAADSLAASWLRSQRSPLAMCAVAAARASSGSPSTIAS